MPVANSAKMQDSVNDTTSLSVYLECRQLVTSQPLLNAQKFVLILVLYITIFTATILILFMMNLYHIVFRVQFFFKHIFSVCLEICYQLHNHIFKDNMNFQKEGTSINFFIKILFIKILVLAFTFQETNFHERFLIKVFFY